MADALEFLDFLSRRIGARAIQAAQAECQSITLREAMEFFVELNRGVGARIILGVPHYWAAYYHDGRGPVTPVEKVWLVYFRDPRDDPRIEGGYPVTRDQIRRLTEEEWHFWLQQNKIAKINQLPEPMIVTKHVGPAEGHPFFIRALERFASELAEMVPAEFAAWMQDRVLLGLRQTATATLRLS